MNERLPYEDELLKRLNDLPLADEDAAWEDMRRRLEKEEKDEPIIPPLLRRCGCYGFVLVLIIIAFLFIADPAKWFHQKYKKEQVRPDSIENKKHQNNTIIKSDKTSPANDIDNKKSFRYDSLNEKDFTGSRTNYDTVSKQKVSIKKSIYYRNNEHRKPLKIHKRKNNFYKRPNNNLTAQNNYQHKPYSKKIKQKINMVAPGNVVDSAISDTKHAEQIDKLHHDPAKENIDSIYLKRKLVLDSIKKKITDTSENVKSNKQDFPKQKSIYFAAGLGLHQLLPIAGQKLNLYNSLGRKNSIADYIPSVYVRMYKNKKWFIQSEFRYGAPQYTRETLFRQSKIIDTSSSTITSTNSNVKKTFYHQVPVSFNYFVLPGFSVGAGITFNQFSSALVQQEVHKSNTITQTDSLISSGLIQQKKADSNFKKSYMQALIETQYQWKRFSAGVRFSFGLQPYLKFQLPGEEQREEKNTSLQIFIRYELWRSGKKKIH